MNRYEIALGKNPDPVLKAIETKKVKDLKDIELGHVIKIPLEQIKERRFNLIERVQDMLGNELQVEVGRIPFFQSSSVSDPMDSSTLNSARILKAGAPKELRGISQHAVYLDDVISSDF